ncbi:reticulocyte-binding protein 2 homolog a-like [Solenopsis invicta]|uniref:reticulocyte-binding protein 2 homolog a-like n=1 Tax=Solenopsis invicta TaxID=13686 RepID=UPI00193D7BDD|nr:reticulocyte-binding protein 2 homolog a-like [Solenopsis invicta]
MILHMEPLENEKEIKKLRVCYRHFCDNDYSGSGTKRILLHFAVPSVNIPFVNVPQHIAESVENVDYSEHVAQHQQQEQEVLNEQSTISQEKHEELVTNSETQLQHMQEILIQQQAILTQQQETLTQQQEKIFNIEETLKVQAKDRPNLEEVTRKILLSPKARKLYDRIVKMKKIKRQQKRRFKTTKQNKSQIIQLSTSNYKGNVDATTHVRQNFVNMIVRNNHVAQQVHHS